jgi:hypothetical protein
MLLLMLALPLELGLAPGTRRVSIGRRTDDDARALAAAFIASLLSSFASFQALILTCFLALLALSACPAVSGSMVEGTIPGSKCGITSSCFKVGSAETFKKESLQWYIPFLLCRLLLNFQRYSSRPESFKAVC